MKSSSELERYAQIDRMIKPPLYEHSIKMNEGAVKDAVTVLATASIDTTVRECMRQAAENVIKPYVAGVVAAQVMELTQEHKALVRAEIERVMPGAIAGVIKVRLPGIVWLEWSKLLFRWLAN
jgi:hypothetical protein